MDTRRTWILIEDNSPKGFLLCQSILKNHTEDRLFWIHTLKNRNPDMEKDLKYLEAKSGPTDRFFYESPDDTTAFETVFGTASSASKCMVLMDVKAPLFENQTHPDDLPTLMGSIKGLLEQKEKAALIFIITNQASSATWKSTLGRTDRRVVISDSHGIVFTTPSEDCPKAIEVADREWKKQNYQNFSPVEDFFHRMKDLSSADCHNNFNPRNFASAEDRERLWSAKLEMPLQLAALVYLLGYDKDTFIQDFQLQNEKGKWREHHPIIDCLKNFGTSDSYNLSLLAALFIAWSVYRDLFPEGKGDVLFKNCINSIGEQLGDIPRNSSISPRQSCGMRKQTAVKFSIMLFKLFNSKKNEDNLRAIHLRSTGLVFDLANILSGDLQESLERENIKRYFSRKEKITPKGGGDSAVSICDFMEHAAFCDRATPAKGTTKTPIIGSPYAFHILSDPGALGVQLVFGHV